MRIWYDALTGKHVRYAVAVAERLRRKGHEITLTTRKHPDTLPLADYLNESFVAVGKFNPKSLLTRLTEGTRRQLKFCQNLRKEPSGRSNFTRFIRSLQSCIRTQQTYNHNRRHTVRRCSPPPYFTVIKAHRCLKRDSCKNPANL